MTKRERQLKESGYIYVNSINSNKEAKEKAQALRRIGKRATVLTESRNGIYYYSVWSKNKEE